MSFKIVVNDNREPNKVIVEDTVVRVIVQSSQDYSNKVIINNTQVRVVVNENPANKVIINVS